MRIAWLASARQDRTSQIDRIARYDISAAIDAGDMLATSIGRLAEFPNSGRAGRLRGTRELVVPGTPFVVVYRIEPGTILILRVLHGAQRWPPAQV